MNNFPPFGVRRPAPWIYAGWIAREPKASTFEELVEYARRSDHGEERVVDLYPEGAICYYREQADD